MRLAKWILLAAAWAVIAAGESRAQLSTTLAPAGDVALLRTLPRLPVAVHSWPPPDLMVRVRDAGVVEFARVAGTVDIRLETLDEAYYASAVKICQQQIARLGLHYSPYYRVFAPGATAGSQDPTRDGSAELAWLSIQLRQLRLFCRWYGREPDEIFLDCEMFTMNGDAVHDAAVNSKYDAVYSLFKSAFPRVRIHWFGRGWMQPNLFDATVRPAPTFGDCQQSGDSRSCAMYRLDQPHEMRASLAATIAAASGQSVVAWICPGGCYAQAWESPKLSAATHHDYTWDWLAGYLRPYPPASQVAMWAVWPSLWEKGPKDAPDAWRDNARHFVAWARGVSRVRKLDDLKGEK